jgi:hypothetical protein
LFFFQFFSGTFFLPLSFSADVLKKEICKDWSFSLFDAVKLETGERFLVKRVALKLARWVPDGDHVPAELEMSRLLNLTHWVQIVDWATDHEFLYIVLEECPEGTLEDYLLTQQRENKEIPEKVFRVQHSPVHSCPFDFAVCADSLEMDV